MVTVILQDKAETLIERLFGAGTKTPPFLFYKGTTPVVIHPASGSGLVQPGSLAALEAVPAENFAAS